MTIVEVRRMPDEVLDLSTCPHWYSVKQQYRHIEDGDWEHRCEEMPDSSSVQWRDGRWVVFFIWGVESIIHCPYCGLELEQMPVAHD